MPGMLAPWRVLDLTDGRAELAAFILAGLGADVIKVEPPGGSPSRHRAPLAPGEPDGLASLAFHAQNRGKRSIVIDLEQADGQCTFADLVATADFVIDNGGPGARTRPVTGFDALRAARPDIVHVSISPFGQTGPWANHRATDLTLAAMGGPMALNGDADRRPVRVTVPQAWLHASAESAVGALVAHERRLATGDAQFVDVSVQASMFWTSLNGMIASAIDGENLHRSGTDLVLKTVHSPLVFPAADGEVCLLPITQALQGLLPWFVEAGIVDQAWIDAEDWSTWERRRIDGAELVHPFDEILDVVRRFTATMTKADLLAGAIARGITLLPVSTTSDVIAMEHLDTRDWWDDITLPSGRAVRAPGPFVKCSSQPVAWPIGAPAVGEHTDEVMADLRPGGTSDERPRTPADVSTGTAVPSSPPARVAAAPSSPPENDRSEGSEGSGGGELPLRGVKVADFSWIGVGPITAKAFADHGATVVRIESDQPVDRLRVVGPFADGIYGVNRCQFFGSFNTSKRSLHLDLKNPTGLDIAQRLLAWCDIAIDSFTAGTMNRLGLGYDAAREINPSIIMIETCLFGQTGPFAPLSGYGYHAAAVSGFYNVTGWDDRPPGGPWNAYTDTVAPRFLTATALAALDHRRRTGEGQYIDQAQMESALHFLGPQLLDTQVSGTVARRDGNVDALCVPHDVYPCAGDDRWCAIAVEDDGQWAALCAVMGSPPWATDPELATASGRRAHIATIDEKLAEFTAAWDPDQLMIELQRAGVPAGVVKRSSETLTDAQLAHRSFFRRLHHPEMGEVPYEGHQYRIDGYDNGPLGPAPCLGEHTWEVLTDLLGLEPDEAAATLASGACG